MYRVSRKHYLLKFSDTMCKENLTFNLTTRGLGFLKNFYEGEC